MRWLAILVLRCRLVVREVSRTVRVCLRSLVAELDRLVKEESKMELAQSGKASMRTADCFN